MKQIPLTQGKFALVDDEDYADLIKYTWCFNHGYASTYVYVGSKDTGGVEGYNVFMHRVINDTPDDMITDHRNGNGLDNRRRNLRTCTPAQNNRNKPRDSTKKSSKYKGVYKFKGRSTYCARIFVNGKQKNLLSIASELEAAQAYNQLALHFIGEFAWLNPVPESAVDDISIFLQKEKIKAIKRNKTPEERRLRKCETNLARYYAKREEILTKARAKWQSKRLQKK